MDESTEKLFAFVKRKLVASKGSWGFVSRGSGIPASTVRKIAQGHTKDPSISTVQAIADYFSRFDQFQKITPEMRKNPKMRKITNDPTGEKS